MKNRTQDYYRHHRIRTIRCKYKILRQLWGWQMVENYFPKMAGRASLWGLFQKERFTVPAQCARKNPTTN